MLLIMCLILRHQILRNQMILHELNTADNSYRDARIFDVTHTFGNFQDLTSCGLKSITMTEESPRITLENRWNSWVVRVPDSGGCGGPQLSHQIQIHHIKYKFITSNTNSPHQIQIHHIKYKFTTSNTNSPHQKQIHPHQIQIHHIKNKFPTSKTNFPHQNQKHRLNGQRLMNESYLQFSLGLHPTAILFLHIMVAHNCHGKIKSHGRTK